MIPTGNSALPPLEDYTSGRRKTLGWDVLDWGSRFLAQPDGKHRGEAWQYTNEQALFILRWYEIDDEGDFVYRQAVLERSKGWGKSPLLAAICCSELLGPVEFAGWDVHGEPISCPAPTPWIQIAAISESQVGNTMSLVGEMLLGGEIARYPGLDVRLSRVLAPGGRRLERVTASPRSRQGNRATFIVMDETHLWVEAEHGPDLYDALANNLSKMGGRWIETTNAHKPGEGSVAETSYQAFLKARAGETKFDDILFDTKEAYVDDIYDWEQAYPALQYVYGDSCKEKGGWIDLKKNIWPRITNPTTTENSARRFFFNEKFEGSSTWIAKDDWNSCRDLEISLGPDDTFALGFKGAVRHGAAVIVACRLSDNALFNLGVWEKPQGSPSEWEVPYAEVDERLRQILELPQCVKLKADPENWQEIIGRIYADFPEKVEEEWLTKNKLRSAKAYEQFKTAVQQRRLRWKDSTIDRHVQSCHILETPQGDLIRKETPHSKRYISAAQASTLALEAAVLSIEEGLDRQEASEIFSF